MQPKLTKLAGPITVFTGASGAEKDYSLGVFPGGSMVKNANYIIEVQNASHTSNLRLTLAVKHSATGILPVAHSTPINAGDPGSTFPTALGGDLDSTKVVNEFLHPTLLIKDNVTTNQMWATVVVYEMRKPF